MEFHLLISISLLLTLFFSFTSSAPLESVYDTDGDALIPGQKYYILPVIRGRGGGLTLMQHIDICPLYVGQENIEVDPGHSLVFRPVNPEDKTIRLSTDMNIKFDNIITICMQSLTWHLGDAEGADNKRYVITGARLENPDTETVNKRFKIEKVEEASYYKLVFCPSVCDTCKVVCGDLGVFIEDEKRLLGLNGDAFPVMFKKVDSEVEVRQVQ